MRIRSIKPEYLRHEILQDLEENNPESRIMLVFQGLWMSADSNGAFEWRPRHLKLDILPFVTYDIEKTLDMLWEHGFIDRYTIDGKKYGRVIAFGKHQRLSGKEATEGVKYPEPSPESIEKHQGSTREAIENHPVAQEGKGKERSTGKDMATGKKPAAIVTDPDAELYQATQAAFLDRNGGRFTDYGKEGKAIKAIIAKARARAPDDAAGFVQSMLEAFWRLKTGRDAFWTGQPFLPSALNAGGIWDRVLETLRDAETDAERGMQALRDLGVVV
jgi:hypothetical protein